MCKCLICNDETDFSLESINYYIFSENDGLCRKHDFAYIYCYETCNNKNHVHEKINAILLLTLIFPYKDPLNKNTDSQTFFNIECSNKIKNILIELSYISEELYFLAIRKLKQILFNIYGNIEKNGFFGLDSCTDKYSDFLIGDGIITCSINENRIQYKFNPNYDKHYIIKYSHFNRCDFCDVCFLYENAISSVYDEDNKPIFKECGNCRKLDLNICKMIKYLNEERVVILKQYLNLFDSKLNSNIIILVMKYLFSDENVNILQKIEKKTY